MPRAETFLDCCAAVSLQRLRIFADSHHGLEALLRCSGCGTYWFYRFHEYPDFATGDDDLSCWYSPLTEPEGKRLRDVPEAAVSLLDLSFLQTRESWMDDNGRVRRVAHAPDRGWW